SSPIPRLAAMTRALTWHRVVQPPYPPPRKWLPRNLRVAFFFARSLHGARSRGYSADLLKEGSARMVRYIKEDEVRQILVMADVVKLVEQGFRDRAAGKAVDIPRRRTLQPGGHLHILQGAAP